MGKINKLMEIGYAELNVRDLDKMTRYYTDTVGLSLIEKTDSQSKLGIAESGKVLLILEETQGQDNLEVKAGLFHTAFLLPERRHLGNTLYNLLKNEVAIAGASDHGYSEALYLQDPEGNGMEIYRDKPKEEWVINDDGTIPGVTEQMDAHGVLDSRDEKVSPLFPEGTVVGHIHLSVSDLKESEQFYTDALGMDLKYEYGAQARFIAAGDYHHHIGMNTWAGSGLPKRRSGDLGLRQFTLVLPDRTDIDKLADRLSENGYPFEREQDSLSVTDPNGIIITFNVIE